VQHSVNSNIAISIVICTQNRADLLADLLQTLCEQDLSTACYEIIVVDNDSKDRTRLVAEDYCRKYDYVRYCIELQHGLSYARNRGWLEAKGEYVGYVDDDCKLPAQWLTVAKEIIDQIAPAIFGGPTYPFYNSQKPYWWKDDYGTLEHSQSPRLLNQSEFLIGCNFFVRRSVLKDMCGFDIRLGMYDQKLGYGEESELQRRLRATMTDEIVYYDPKLFVYHLVRPEQMSLRWNLNSRFVGGRYSNYVFNDNNALAVTAFKLNLLAQAVQILPRLFLDIIVGLLRRDHERYPYLQNYLYENTFKYVRNFGAIYEKYCLCK
jgi:glycosyltransferase involved in cell wall biosynthesis